MVLRRSGAAVNAMVRWSFSPRDRGGRRTLMGGSAPFTPQPTVEWSNSRWRRRREETLPGLCRSRFPRGKGWSLPTYPPSVAGPHCRLPCGILKHKSLVNRGLGNLLSHLQQKVAGVATGFFHAAFAETRCSRGKGKRLPTSPPPPAGYGGPLLRRFGARDLLASSPTTRGASGGIRRGVRRGGSGGGAGCGL